MSPQRFAKPAPDSVRAAERRLWVGLGSQIREARIARRWTAQALADRAGVSRGLVYLLEAGETASTEATVRLATALGLRVELDLVDPRRRAGLRPVRMADPVHSAMGEFEAGHFRRLGYPHGLDEPYQHYQFAGRADVVAWDLATRALLHLENRTRFPDFQEMAGSYNSKRAYLGRALAERLGIRGWASETHAVVALWSAEVLHAIRLRPDSFRALCPDPPDAFGVGGRPPPPPADNTSSLVVLDPLASGRQRAFVGLQESFLARPRHRGYAEAAARFSALQQPDDARRA
jgi:transcriptional regulator with XRE-family HTH domain